MENRKKAVNITNILCFLQIAVGMAWLIAEWKSLPLFRVERGIAIFLRFFLLGCGIFYLTGLKAATSKVKRCLWTVALLLFPPVLQICLYSGSRVLPLFLFLVFVRILTENMDYSWKREALMILVFLAGALREQEYGYLCGIFWLLLIFYRLRRSSKSAGKNKLVIQAAVCCGAIILFLIFNTAATEKRDDGSMPDTLVTRLMCNISYEDLEEDYYFWPEDVKELITPEMVRDCMRDKEEFSERLGRYLRPRMSYDEAKEVSWQIVKATLENRSKQTIQLVGTNLAEYFLTPLTVWGNCMGYRKSSTAYRLMELRGAYGNMNRVYLIYSAIFLLYFCISFLRLLLSPERKDPKKAESTAAVIMVWLVWSIFYAVFGAVYFDYILMTPALVLLLLSGLDVTHSQDSAGDSTT